MAKFELKAKPTFKAKVAFPVHGGASVDVELTFKHRTKSALDEFIKSSDGKSDADAFMEMVEGWELEDEFTRENVTILLDHHIGIAVATVRAYIDELAQSRAKN